MEIKIDEEIIKKAQKCEKNLSCLSIPSHVYCQVEHCVEGEIHFVKCLDATSCNYMMSFGDSFICRCPVRKEMFNRYKI